MLRKDPAFVAVAVLTLALGIGANSTVFSWTNATLLNPIPGISDASQVVSITRGRAGSHAYPDLVDLGERSHSFAGATGFALDALSLTGNGKPEQVWGMLVTANYFDVLGVKPAHGRGFLPADDKVEGGAPVAVISDRLWQNRFGGDPSAVGQTIHINTHTYTIVGIAPPVFQGSYTGLRADLWVPMMMAPQLMPGEDRLVARDTAWLQALGRLRPGVSGEQAQAELTTLFQEIARQYPDSHKGTNQITVYPLWRAPNGANAFFSKLLPILLGLAAVVLLLACANLANLLLVRSVSRQKELAIRLALGASRRRTRPAASYRKFRSVACRRRAGCAGYGLDRPDFHGLRPREQSSGLALRERRPARAAREPGDLRGHRGAFRHPAGAASFGNEPRRRAQG